MIERNIGCLQTSDTDDAQNAAGGQEVIFFSIGFSSRNSRCLCFALFMNAQIDQTEKTQGAFIVYENVLFIRGKVKKLTKKTQEKMVCKSASAVNRSRSPTAMTSCANNLLNEASRGIVMTADGDLSSKS